MVKEEKKVILLAPTPPPAGGIARWTMRMLNAKLDYNWKIELIDEKVIGKREVFGKNAKKNFIEEIKRCIKIWTELNKKLKDKNVFVVHSCIPSATLSMIREYICACITKHHKKKFIIHFRCTVPNTTKGRIGKIILELLCKKSDKIIILNRQSEEFLKKITNTDLKLIPNFIDSSELVNSKIINKQIKKVIYTGGVIEQKGCKDIIKVAEAYPNVEFKLIGKIDQEIKQSAEKYKNVVITDEKSSKEITEELKMADVFIFLSYFSGEGFSNALVEAMAAGLPCIVSDWAANADMIENKGGIIVPCKSPEKAIEALRKIKDFKIRQMQSEFNIKKVRDNYIDYIVINKYVNLYEECLIK